MAFRYTDPPLTQHLAALVGAGAVVGLLILPGADAAWDRYLAATPEWFHFAGMVFVLHALVYWGMGLFFGYVDRYDAPRFVARYRIQTDRKKRPPARRVAWVLAWNQLFWTPLILVGIGWLLELRGWESSSGLPSPLRFVTNMGLLAIFSAVYFYLSHRFLHRPWWMKRVHKLHHEFRTSAAIAAEYAHWFEFIFGNFGTLAVGVIILAPSLATIYAFTVLGTMTFVIHHAGYAIPWMSWAVHHDWHHYRFHEAFGTFGHIDRWLGTSEEFESLEDGQIVP